MNYDLFLAGLFFCHHSNNTKRSAELKKYTGVEEFPMDVEDAMRIMANLIIDRILEDKRMGKLKKKRC